MAIGFGKDYQIVTSVLLCRVTREELQHVSERLEYLFGAIMNGMDGFLSATLEKSLQGDAVVVFSQWQSQNQHVAMFKDPTVRDCLRDLEIICQRVDSQIFQTVKTFEHMPRSHLAPGVTAQESHSSLQ
jgi:heme-degrading monooxygenase HmoA